MRGFKTFMRMNDRSEMYSQMIAKCQNGDKSEEELVNFLDVRRFLIVVIQSKLTLKRREGPSSLSRIGTRKIV